MKLFVGFLFSFFLLVVGATAQDIASLIAELEKEQSPARLAEINNMLAEKYLTVDGEKAILHAEAAIKNADIVKNNTIKAEALNFQAKATAGLYAPNKVVPNRRSKSTSQYYDASTLFNKSTSLSQSIGYTQLELDNLENLAYLNTKNIGRHDANEREEVKYYKLYIERMKEIKNVTKPTATTPTASSNNARTDSSSSDKLVKQLVAEKLVLENRVKALEKELDDLKRKIQQVLGND